MKLKVKSTFRIDLVHLSLDQATAIKIALGKSSGSDYDSEELNEAADEVYDLLNEHLKGKIADARHEG